MPDAYTHPDGQPLLGDAWHRFIQNRPPRLYEKNSLIYMQGQNPDYLYCLLSGRVVSFLTSEDGADQTLAEYSPGSIFGEASFFDRLPRISSARTTMRSEIVIIDRDTILRQISDDPGIAVSLLEHLARTVRMLSCHVDSFSFSHADKRISGILVQMHSREQITCTHEELGSRAGVSRVTVSRTLKRFSDRGWICTGYKQIKVKDPEALFRFSTGG